ncbi:MFS transporter [Halalkalibacterium halodurans]|uniref:MDR family MFS transporter n=1 Tax=Halalkalibacterium halodurans TaxID=86665 RepID=UPI001067A57F|nr:MFS transporter [Halalkalibacterium halodurans]TES54390.1 MFS transporter [Halalkalibacterium halodurans]
MPKPLWLLVIGMVINVTAASFLWPLNTIYMSRELGQSLAIAGLVLMCNAGAGVIGNLIGGMMFDRIGAYRTIILSIWITIISAFILAYNHTFFYYATLMVGLGFGSGMMFPAMYALAGKVWPQGGRKSFNAMYVAQNVGVAVGTALAGIVASISFDWIFLANGLVYVGLLLFVMTTFRSFSSSREKSGATTNVFEQNQAIRSKRPLIALLILCVGFFICWVAYVQWQSTISVHTQNLGIHLKQYSVLWTVNGAMIVLCQPFIAFIVKRWVPTLKVQIYVGLAVFMIAYFVLTQATIFSMFLIAMIILTIGEMFVWPAIPTVAHQLAPEGKAGFYQGIVNSVATGGRMFGPFIGGVLADAYGMETLFYVLGSMFVLAFVTTAFYDRVLLTKRSEMFANKGMM